MLSKTRRLLLGIPLFLASFAVLALIFHADSRDQHHRMKRHAFMLEGRRIEERKTNFMDVQCRPRNGTAYQEMLSQQDQSQFPADFFTLEQRQRGAVLLHLFGLIYMFIALAIVCDEFFVPSLGVITERLDISDDVAGATFMAAGGSAPEFFTSVIGTFVAQNNVGIGTIVGSATFNILCVLAFCTLFSREVLQLSWWPLFRDVAFYIISLLILVGTFLDEQVFWWEALALFAVYAAYALFMKFNASIEFCVKRHFGCRIEVEEEEMDQPEKQECKETALTSGREQLAQPVIAEQPRVIVPQQHLQQQEWPRRGHQGLHRSDTVSVHRTFQPGSSMRRRQSSIAHSVGASRRQSIPILHSGAMFRNGIISLMSQTLDPLDEGADHAEEGKSRVHQSIHMSSSLQQNGTAFEQQQPILKRRDQNGNLTSSRRRSGQDGRTPRVDFEEIRSVLEEEGERPLDMRWPRQWHKQALYLFLAPILFPLWLSMADVRRPEKRRYFAATFFLSILWIAAFSYLMVWLANTIGLTLGIPTEVIGLTILAAGTSIPDLITSVIVARKGLGDMAVSSSVGSNIFDVCVGLPIPWLLFFGWHFLTSISPVPSVPVSSQGLICSVGMLFLMLLLLLAAVALCGWRMNKAFGCIMVVAYLAFCALSIGLELGQLACPLRIC